MCSASVSAPTREGKGRSNHDSTSRRCLGTCDARRWHGRYFTSNIRTEGEPAEKYGATSLDCETPRVLTRSQARSSTMHEAQPLCGTQSVGSPHISQMVSAQSPGNALGVHMSIRQRLQNISGTMLIRRLPKFKLSQLACCPYEAQCESFLHRRRIPSGQRGSDILGKNTCKDNLDATSAVGQGYPRPCAGRLATMLWQHVPRAPVLRVGSARMPEPSTV